MLHQLAGSLVPVVFVVSLGYGLARFGLLQREAQKGMNFIAYWVGLPSLLFLRSAQMDFARWSAVPMFVVLSMGMLVSVVVGWWLSATPCGLRGASRAVFVQACYRGNIFFAALPILVYSLEGQPEAWSQAVLEDTLLAIVPLTILYNLVAVLVLAAGRHVEQQLPGRLLARTLLTNPLILALLAGLAWNLLGAPLPLPAYRSLKVLDSLALPLALLSIGAQLSFVHARVLRFPVYAVAAIKLALGPALGFILAGWMGLDLLQRHAVLLILAAPTAVSSYVLADQMHTDSDLAAGCVLVSTVLSVFSFSAVLALL